MAKWREEMDVAMERWLPIWEIAFGAGTLIA